MNFEDCTVILETPIPTETLMALSAAFLISWVILADTFLRLTEVNCFSYASECSRPTALALGTARCAADFVASLSHRVNPSKGRALVGRSDIGTTEVYLRVDPSEKLEARRQVSVVPRLVYWSILQHPEFPRDRRDEFLLRSSL
jgi:hypothetical protein